MSWDSPRDAFSGGGQSRGTVVDLAGLQAVARGVASRRQAGQQGGMPGPYRIGLDRHAPVELAPGLANARTKLMSAAVNPWFSVLPRGDAPATLRLYCFPYAGAAYLAFQHWRAHLSGDIELALIRLPGRGARFYEPQAASLEALAETLANAIADAQGGPEHFALFGHSMGALLAFETARALSKRGLSPRALLVCARTAPVAHGWRERISELSDAAFLEAIRSTNGLPKGVLDSPEWLELFLPIIRADFALCENYHYRPGLPLACPISVLAGQDDASVPPSLLKGWAGETRAGCQTWLFPGGHFCGFGREAELLGLLQRQLCPQRKAWYATV